MSKRITHTYHSPTDDFVETADQGHTLPVDYAWVRDGAGSRCASSVLYAAGLVFAFLYTRIHLRMRVRDCRDEGRGSAAAPYGNAGRADARSVIAAVSSASTGGSRDTALDFDAPPAYFASRCANDSSATSSARRGGCMLFCNHTQPVGDAFTPARAMFPQRTYVLVSPANLGIPVIGRLLPSLGALPIPDDVRGMRQLKRAVSRRLGEGACVVVYPEAHVWPYYTGIRPFPATSFAFAVDNEVPVYCLTSTYQRPRLGARPKTTAFLDGPFLAPEGASRRQAREALRDAVYDSMVRRSAESTYDYVRYVPAADAEWRGRGSVDAECPVSKRPYLGRQAGSGSRTEHAKATAPGLEGRATRRPDGPPRGDGGHEPARALVGHGHSA